MLCFPLVPCCVRKGPWDLIRFGETMERTLLPNIHYGRSKPAQILTHTFISSFCFGFFFLLIAISRTSYYFKGDMGNLLLLSLTKVVLSYPEP